MTEKHQNTKKPRIRHRVLTMIGVILCIVLIPILAINTTLIVKSYISKDGVPSVGGHFPMIVLTDSMYPKIHSGDLIICRVIDAEAVKKGDVIAFFDPAGNGSSVVTHRVTKVVKKNRQLAFQTQGDANNTPDTVLVPAENLAGIYMKRIPGAGNVAMFLQTVPGLIICVISPLALLIGYDMIRRRRYEKLKKQDTDALLAELQKLKEEKNAPIPDNSNNVGKDDSGSETSRRKGMD